MPVKDEQGNVVFICAEGRDITEKKAYEREIARQREIGQRSDHHDHRRREDPDDNPAELGNGLLAIGRHKIDLRREGSRLSEALALLRRPVN